MKKRARRRTESRTAKLLAAIGYLSFIVAVALIVIMIIMQRDKPNEWYQHYLEIFRGLEIKIAEKTDKLFILTTIFLLFILRANTWIYPLPVMYFVSAMVFDPLTSFLINLAGSLIMCAMRYYTGIQMGEGFWNKVIKKHPEIDMLFRLHGKQNPYTLFALRFVPYFPFNTVSHIYGTFEFPFWKYMLISAAALIPRLISYSYIGKNVYDPLSTKFYLPLAFLLVLSGSSMFLLRGLLVFLPSRTRRRRAENSHAAQ